MSRHAAGDAQGRDQLRPLLTLHSSGCPCCMQGRTRAGSPSAPIRAVHPSAAPAPAPPAQPAPAPQHMPPSTACPMNASGSRRSSRGRQQEQNEPTTGAAATHGDRDGGEKPHHHPGLGMSTLLCDFSSSARPLPAGFVKRVPPTSLMYMRFPARSNPPNLGSSSISRPNLRQRGALGRALGRWAADA